MEVVELLDTSPDVCESKASPLPAACAEIISCATTDSDDDVVVIVDDKPISPPAANEVTVTDPAAPTTISATTAMQAVNASHRTSDLVKSLLEQYECGICFETMACAVSLTPCGDSFCYNCIADWALKATHCPFCNAPFDLKHSVPNRLVENSVREILKNEQEALSAWETRAAVGRERRKQALAAPPSSTPPVDLYLPLPHPMNFINQRPSAPAPFRQNSRGFGSQAIVDLTGGSDSHRVRPHNNHYHHR